MTVSENPSDKPSDPDVPADVRVVEISREPAELYKILKFEGMVSSGGQAKGAVAAGQVRVNGKIELQKRKKIVAGDSIEFNSEKFRIRFVPIDTGKDDCVAGKGQTRPKEEVIEGTNGNSVARDVQEK